MPIMSSTATATNPSTTQPTKNDIKQIGICLPSNSQIEMPTVATNNSSTNSLNLSSNATKNVVTNSTNNFYTTATTAGQFQMGSLSVMVAKLNPSLSSTRQQTVILQPRINTTTRGATLQIQNSVRSTSGTAQTSQNISTSFASSNTSSISVRTRVISGQANHASTTIPVLNLSTVANVSTSTAGGSATSSNVTTNSVKQMIAGQKFITTAGNVETVNLVMASPNEMRNLKTNTTNNEIKSLYTVNKINGPKQLTGSTATAALVTAQTASKMISINNASGQSCATTTRLGILGGSANNKPALINLPKNFILTPTGASGIANMVSISSANFSTNRIPNQIIARQAVTTTIPTSQPTSSNNLPSSTTGGNKSTPTIYTVNTNAATTNVLSNPNIITTLQPIMSNNQQNNSQNASSNIATSISSSTSSSLSTTPSTLVSSSIVSNSTKPSNIQSINSNNISPIKSTTTNVTFPSQQTATSSSPRPRILSRKRPITDTASSATTITIKPNNANATNGSLTFVTTATNQQGSNQSQMKNDQQLSINKCPSMSTINVNFVETVKIESTNNSQNSLENNLTPRKKPRKQLLEPSSPKNKLISFSTNQQCDQQLLIVNNNDHHQQINFCPEKEIKEQKLVVIKKPRPSLINHQSSYIVKFQHFSRYSEVKQKHDKKLTLQDLINDIRKENEWKDFVLTEQCKKLADDEDFFTLKSLELFLSTLEEEICPFSKCAALSTLYNDIDDNTTSTIENNTTTTTNNRSSISSVDRKCVRINDIIRANIQRSKVLCEHFMECNQIIQKVTHEHKDKVTNLTKRLSNKRSYSK